MIKRRYFLLGVALVLGLTGCGGVKPASLAVQAGQKTAGSSPAQGDVITYSGKLAGVVETNIFAKTSGRVARVYKDVGDFIHAGDVLVSLETTDLNANLQSANADLALAEAKYQEVKNGSRQEDIRSAQAAYEQAYQKYLDTKKGKRPEEIAKLKASLQGAQTNYETAKVIVDRQKALYSQGAASKQSLDDAEVAFRQAESQYVNAKNDLILAIKGPTQETLNSLKANADQMKALLDKAKDGSTPESIAQSAASVTKARAIVSLNEYNLQNGIIKSPLSGYVAVKNTNAGEMVSPSAPLMTVVDLDQMYLSISVPESELKLMQTGKEVKVQVDALGKTLKGKISMVSPKADSGTDKFTVKILIDNKNHELRSGMTGIVVVSQS